MLRWRCAYLAAWLFWLNHCQHHRRFSIEHVGSCTCPMVLKREFGPLPSTYPSTSEPARVVTISAVFNVRRRREEKEKKRMNQKTNQENTKMNDKENSSYVPTALKRMCSAKEQGWWVEVVVVWAVVAEGIVVGGCGSHGCMVNGQTGGRGRNSDGGRSDGRSNRSGAEISRDLSGMGWGIRRLCGLRLSGRGGGCIRGDGRGWSWGGNGLTVWRRGRHIGGLDRRGFGDDGWRGARSRRSGGRDSVVLHSYWWAALAFGTHVASLLFPFLPLFLPLIIPCPWLSIQSMRDGGRLTSTFNHANLW